MRMLEGIRYSDLEEKTGVDPLSVRHCLQTRLTLLDYKQGEARVLYISWVTVSLAHKRLSDPNWPWIH